MFTDNPVTPMRLETLLEVLRAAGSRGYPSKALAQLLQPVGLKDLEAGSDEFTRFTVRAGIELDLIHRESDSVLLTEAARGRKSVRECVLDALDARVLASTDVEDYFALFYSYMLGREDDSERLTNQQWVDGFTRDVFGGQRSANPFNPTKLSGINRWLEYAGLGWWDPGEVFQCNPYWRLRRRLADIFARKKKLEDEELVEKTGRLCPELDGGDIFLRANPLYDRTSMRLTRGLGNALVDLHLDEVIRLHCNPDSGGWGLQRSSPPNDGKTLLSDRLDFVEWIGKE